MLDRVSTEKDLNKLPRLDDTGRALSTLRQAAVKSLTTEQASGLPPSAIRLPTVKSLPTLPGWKTRPT